MKKLYLIIAAILLLFGNALAAPSLITVPEKATGETLSAAEFNQILGGIQTGTTERERVVVGGVCRAWKYYNSAGEVTRIDVHHDAAITDYGNATTVGSIAWAIQQIATTTGAVYINSGGPYLFTSAAVLKPGVSIIGLGRPMLKLADTSTKSMFIYYANLPGPTDYSLNIDNITIEGLYLDGNGANTNPTVASTGTHTGGANAADLTDSAANGSSGWVVNEWVGYVIQNVSDGTFGSWGLITANTATTITATLTGGTDNDWDNGDTYKIWTCNGIEVNGTAWLEESNIQNNVIANFDGVAIKLRHPRRGRISHNQIWGNGYGILTGDHIDVLSNDITSNAYQAIGLNHHRIETATSNLIYHMRIIGNNFGYNSASLASGSAAVGPGMCYSIISNNTFYLNSRTALYVSDSNVIANNTFEKSGEHGLRLGVYNNVQNNYFEDQPTDNGSRTDFAHLRMEYGGNLISSNTFSTSGTSYDEGKDVRDTSGTANYYSNNVKITKAGTAKISVIPAVSQDVSSGGVWYSAALAGHYAIRSAGPFNFILSTTGTANYNVDPSADTFPTGCRVTLVNNDGADNLVFDSSGLNQALTPGQVGVFIYTGTAWKKISLN